jgi:SAM-dependent methyltransferase
MTNQGIGTGKYFNQYYASRDWRSYRFLLRLVMDYAEPGPILDVGAGTGLFVEGAMRWGLTCQGLEGSSEAIAIARKRYPDIQLIQHMLSEPFPFPAEMFGTVVMNQVIEHLESLVARRAVAEAFRVLQPGGMLFVASPSVFNAYERTADPTHIHLYSPRELRDLLVSTGFMESRAMDSPLDLLGSSKFGRKIMSVVFRRVHWERLSATANCIAYKGSRTSDHTAESNTQPVA